MYPQKRIPDQNGFTHHGVNPALSSTPTCSSRVYPVAEAQKRIPQSNAYSEAYQQPTQYSSYGPRYSTFPESRFSHVDYHSPSTSVYSSGGGSVYNSPSRTTFSSTGGGAFYSRNSATTCSVRAIGLFVLLGLSLGVVLVPEFAGIFAVLAFASVGAIITKLALDRIRPH